ncbi:hypothetical protein Taro_056775, partial [Colocasia esculenta]|nr:hypothetical protein [Colocasia esculenta]
PIHPPSGLANRATLATTSRGVRSGRSSRPRPHRVLCFPHHRQWTMEYSCKVWCKPCRHRPTPRQHSRPSWRPRLIAFDHRTLDEALSAACRQEGEMEQYLEEKKASQKRPAATFQRQDKKKTVYQTPQKPMIASNSQRPEMDANTNPGVQRYGRQSLWPAYAAELQTSKTRKPAIGGLSPTALKAVKSPDLLLQGGCWIDEEGLPDLGRPWSSLRNPESSTSKSFLGQPKESFTEP